MDYLRHELEPEEENRLESHLKHCPSCINFMRTYEYVPNLSRDLLQKQMPETVKQSLMQFLRHETGHAH